MSEKKPKNKHIGYQVKTVSRPRPSGKNTKKMLLITGVLIINLAFLGGFMSFYSRFASQIITNNDTLNSLAELGNNSPFANVGIPLLDKSSLGLFSTDLPFPQIQESEPEVQLQFQNLLLKQSIFNGEEVSSGLPAMSDQKWQIFGSYSYSGQEGNKNDLVWYNNETNSIMAWSIENNELTGLRTLPTIKNTSYQLVSLADYNGDGETDYMWRSNSANDDLFLLWTMSGERVVKQQWVEVQVQDVSDWMVAGTADFDGNGAYDLVLRYTGSGQDYQGANLIHFFEYRNNNLEPKATETIKWLPWLNDITASDGQKTQELAAIVDIDYDGFPDIAWRKNANSEQESDKLLIWLMNDLQRSSTIELDLTKDANWLPTFYDVDNNNSYDIIWRNTGISNVPSCKDGVSIWLLSPVFRSQTQLVEEIKGC